MSPRERVRERRGERESVSEMRKREREKMCMLYYY